MAHRAKAGNRKNHRIQIMENKQNRRDTKERVRAFEAAEKADKEKNR